MVTEEILEKTRLSKNLKEYRYLINIGTDVHKEAGFIPLDPDHIFFQTLNVPPGHGYFRLSNTTSKAVTLVFSSAEKIIENTFVLTKHAHGIQVNDEYIFITDKRHKQRGHNLYLNLEIKEPSQGTTVFEDIAKRHKISLLYNLVPSNDLLETMPPL